MCVMICVCVSGCDAEPQCSVADLRNADSAAFFSCSLYPDSRVCGAYDKPLRRTCRRLLDKTPNNTYSKMGKCGLWLLVHFRPCCDGPVRASVMSSTSGVHSVCVFLNVARQQY